MLFNSFHFILFFPAVVLVYFLVPAKLRYVWLLLASYYFYMSWNAKYAVLIAFSTFVTWGSGMLLGACRKRGAKGSIKKWIVVLSFVINLGILAFFKYFDFMLDNVNFFLGKAGLQAVSRPFDLILPVGISFYTFQALSYTMDVYRGDITAERNFFMYALFVSFFPQLVAGPIERSKNLLRQVNQPHAYDYDNMREGLLVMLWGFFLKLVVADRVAVIVNTVYGDYPQYGGMYIIVASVLFAIQIYCDFAGYSTIAIGAAKVLGFQLMENFDCPYFACSIGEFWRRWHISLSSWFRDYLYIPLGGNRRGTLIKYRNLVIVFLVSGLWHGAAATYVVWGLIHGIYQVIGGITRPVRDKLNRLFALKPESIGHKLVSGLITFALVDFAWIFFRAETIKDAFLMIKSMVHVGNIHILWDGSLYELGLSAKSFMVLVFGIAVMIVADFLKYRGIRIRDILIEQELWCRWLCYITAFWFILVFGVWGGSYDASSFIYFQF